MRHEEEKSGGVAGLVFVACFATIAGVIVAAVQLALRPVQATPLKPSEPKTKIVCIPGSDSTSTKGYDDRAKAILRGVPGNYVFTEGDINAIIMKHFGTVLLVDGIEFARISELPNVRFMEKGKVQISVVLTFPDWFDKQQFVYQVRGKIVSGGFKPEMGWIGQCPLPFLNNYFLQGVRKRLEFDKSVKDLDKIHNIASFSRDGDALFVNVAGQGK